MTFKEKKIAKEDDNEEKPTEKKEEKNTKKFSSKTMDAAYDTARTQYRFLFTGHHKLGAILREFFRQNKNPRLDQLETDLKNIMSISCENSSLSKTYFLNGDQKKAAKKTKKKDSKKEKVKKKLAAFMKPKDTGPNKDILQKIFPGCIGAAMADFSIEDERKKPLNLLPHLVRSIALWKKTSNWFYVMATVMLIFSVTWLMAFGFTWGQTLAQIRTAKQNLIIVERQLTTKKPLTLEQKINTANSELERIRSLQGQKVNFSDAINDVKEIIPDTVEVVAIQYGLLSDNTLMELKGVAPDRETVIDTYKLISLLPFVKNVVFPASNFNERTFSVDFSLQFSLKETPSSS